MDERDRPPFGEPFERRNPMFRQLLTAGLVLSAAGLAAGAWYFQPRSVSSQTSADPTSPLPRPIQAMATAVSALGQLEPQGRIIRLSPPAAAEGSRIQQVLIQEGQSVQAGQIVAVLDTQVRRLAALRKAESDVAIAQARLDQVKSGQGAQVAAQQAAVSKATAEQGAAAAQLETIRRLSAQLQDAKTQFSRFEQLQRDGAISAADLDARRLTVTTIEAQLREAEAQLVRVEETSKAQVLEAAANLERSRQTNPTAVSVAEAELAGAKASLEQAKTDLELSNVRSPVSGTVIKLHARPGESIGQNGIAEIGRTGQMEVIAQVYKTDVVKVQAGQSVKVTSDVFSGELQGTVTDIGLQVKKQEVFDSNPLAATDNNVVDVRIRLDPDSSRKVSAFSNLQVRVVIAI